MMKIVDAYWEKRNLGVECVEISIEPTDAVAEIHSRLKDINAPYIVIKVPSGNMDVMFKLSEWGFVFIESVINVVHDLKDIELSGIYKRINTSISYSEMGQDDCSQLFTEIQKGMFSTDRVSVDPVFSKDIGARRYVNWINDEIKKDTKIYKVYYKNDII
ncbi:MAG: hypothetical protein AAGU75_17220, partial [Bacillota bacterium]